MRRVMQKSVSRPGENLKRTLAVFYRLRGSLLVAKDLCRLGRVGLTRARSPRYIAQGRLLRKRRRTHG